MKRREFITLLVFSQLGRSPRHSSDRISLRWFALSRCQIKFRQGEAKMGYLRRSTTGILAAIALLSIAAPVHAGKLRAVMHSDLKILDPIWTTAYIVRNHGYMIYDTLFATDANGEIKPQMVGKYDVSPDMLTHTFALRDGLVWHDGQPVTASVASINRWAARDTGGQKLMTFVSDLKVVDSKTFVMQLKEPTGLVLLGLGKSSPNVPFMMPRRVAETDPNTQISDFTGSGPFVFKRDEWKPGDRTVYVKFDKYVPRPEAASGLAGGKVAKFDRIEWRAISDHQQAVNACSLARLRREPAT
jgi:peptide/nickel transport system substrate-binding protein